MSSSHYPRLVMLFVLLAVLLPVVRPAYAQAFVVNSTADTSDGACTASANGCTLREAIIAANASAGPDTITFSVSGTILVGDDLPALTDGGTTIDGGPSKGVIINGANAGVSQGLIVNSANNTVQGLVIVNFQGTEPAVGGVGIFISGPGATGNKIYNNYLGVAADGTTAQGNRQYGVLLDNGASNNDVGGTGANQGNVIAGNEVGHVGITMVSSTQSPIANNRIAGNRIGTNAAGTAPINGAALGGLQAAIFVENYARSNTIGPGNIIGGNFGNNSVAGIKFSSTTAAPSPTNPDGNQIVGNYIGVSTNGTAVPNRRGIELASNTANTTIGNPANLAAGRNYIAGNENEGVYVNETSFAIANTVIVGNYIGLGPNGTPRPNGASGVYVGNNPAAVQTTIGPGNVISANDTNGIQIRSSNNVVKGNFIGTNPAGTQSSLGTGSTPGFANRGPSILIENGSNNVIGGPSDADRNVIALGGGSSGIASQNAIRISPSTGASISNTTIENNHVGVNVTASNALVSPIDIGVSSISIGASSNGVVRNNVIGGNGRGVGIGASGYTIENNFIGTNRSGATDDATLLALGNAAEGVFLLSGSGNTIRNNVVANNGDARNAATAQQGRAGIYVPTGGSNNSIVGNRVLNNGKSSTTNAPGILVEGATGIRISQTETSGNAADGIALTVGGNGNLAAPTLTGVSGSPAVLAGTAPAACGGGGCTVEVFTNGTREDGEGPNYLTAKTGVGTGPFSIDVSGCSPFLTATVTDANGNTSPFSKPMLQAPAGVCTPPSFTLSPASPSSQTVAPGASAVYTHQVRNNDAVARTLTISLGSSQGWATAPATINVAANASVTFNVTVTAPASATDGTVDTTKVTVSFGGVSQSQTDTTTVEQVPLRPAAPAISPGQTRTIPGPATAIQVTFTHQVTNTGEVAGTFALIAPTFVGAPPAGWSIGSATLATANLGPGASTTATVVVNVPANAQAGSVAVQFGVRETTNGNQTPLVRDTVIVAFTPGFTFVAQAPTTITTPPGITAVFSHTLTNTGNGPDSFTVSATPQSPLTIASITPSNPIQLAAGASVVVQVSVALPGTTPPATYNIGVTAQRTAGPTPAPITNQNQVTVVSGGVPVITPGAAQNVPANTATVVTFTNTLRNNGNAAVPFSFPAPTVPAGWSATIVNSTCPTPPATLANGTTCTFDVEVSVPANADGGPANIVVRATADNNPPAQDITASATNVVNVAIAAGIDFAPTPLELSGDPGTVVTYTHTLTNTGNATDSFTLTQQLTGPSGWSATVTPTQLLDLPRDTARTVTVEVTVPRGVAADSANNGVVEVTATAANDPATSASVIDTTTINPVDGATLSPGTTANAETSETESATVTFTHTLTNTGSTTIAYDIQAENSIASWPAPVVTSANPTGQIAPGLTTTVTIAVTAPAGLETGITNTTTLQVFAAGTTTPVLATAEDITRVGPQFAVLLVPVVNEGTGKPNATTIYTHTLTNIGTQPDSYVISTTDSLGWEASVVPSLVDLGPNQSTVITVTLFIPDGVRAGTPGFTRVNVQSLNNPEVVAQGEELTTVLQVAGVEIAPRQFVQIRPESDWVTLDFTLTNTGNGIDTFDLSVDDDLGWELELDPVERRLAPSGVFPAVQVRVRVPNTIESGTLNVVRVTARSRTDPTVAEVAPNTFTYVERRSVLFPSRARLYLPIVNK